MTTPPTSQTPRSIVVHFPNGDPIALYAGPYRRRPVGMRGVKMAAEIDLPADVRVDTED